MNNVELCGKVVSGLTESERLVGEVIYTFELAVKRTSGTNDTIVCRVSDRVSGFKDLAQNKGVYVKGRFASHTEITENVSRLHLTVFVETIEQVYNEGEPYSDINSIRVLGTVSKIKELKNTGTRVIQEMNLLVPRKTQKTDLLPVVAWGRTATYCNESLNINDTILVNGRIQSRDRVGTNNEAYRLYSVSVLSLEVVDDAEAVNE